MLVKALSVVVGLTLAVAADAQIIVTSPLAVAARLKVFPHPGFPGLYQLTLTGTASGVDEYFLFYVPGTGTASTPLVVGFHSYSVSPNQFLNLPAAEVINQAALHNWYAVCPMGAYDVNFGVWKWQANVEEVLDWVDDHYNIDHDRVYGIGFSMGGNWMMSYAARHADPTRPMFAAVVNHTGGMSLTYTHAQGDPTVNAILEHPLMLEGPPTGQYLFGYLRSQSINLDPFTLAVDQTNDMARNLTHVDVYNFHSDNDTLLTSVPLKTSVDKFNAQLQLRLSQASSTIGAGGGSTQLVVGPDLPNVPPHSWGELDIPAAFTWLAGQTRSIPSASGGPGIICDRNGRWFHMDVTLGTATNFATFVWGLAAGQNRFGILASNNLAKVFIRSAEVGLVTTNPSNPVILNLASADSTTDEVSLNGFATPPLVTPPGTQWSHDPATGTVTIFTLGTFQSVTLTP